MFWRGLLPRQSFNQALAFIWTNTITVCLETASSNPQAATAQCTFSSNLAPNFKAETANKTVVDAFLNATLRSDSSLWNVVRSESKVSPEAGVATSPTFADLRKTFPSKSPSWFCQDSIQMEFILS